MTEKPDHEQLAEENDAEMSAETFRRWVRQMDPTLSPDDVASDAAVVMLAALQLGNKDRRLLSEFPGFRSLASTSLPSGSKPRVYGLRTARPPATGSRTKRTCSTPISG